VSQQLAASQIRIIKTAVRQLGIDDPTYRQLLVRVAGVDSSKKLSQRGFNDVLDELARLGWTSSSNRKPFASRNRPGYATNAQISLIRRCFREWSGRDDDRGLNAWIKRTFGVDHLKWLTIDDAPKAVAGCKAMAARRAEQEAPPAA